MKTLIIGAGSIGGYFGGRMLAAGRDVTFLVRPARQEKLKQSGLVIKSPSGDVSIDAPPTVTSNSLDSPFDLIILTCKAYDLPAAISDLAPAVGPKTLILPLLNGMSHIDLLDQKFGADHVLGGWCAISTTLDSDGRIHHMGAFQSLSFGARSKAQESAVAAIHETLANANFEALLRDNIMFEMWMKWVFIASLGSATSLMRASVGDIIEAGAVAISTGLLAECAAIASKNGFAPDSASMERNSSVLTTKGSPLTASMARDIENKNAIEADHIVGDLLKRGGEDKSAYPLLSTAYAHLKSYEARRAREQMLKA
jgi:2-dehydropantoate 2-reductase